MPTESSAASGKAELSTRGSFSAKRSGDVRTAETFLHAGAPPQHPGSALIAETCSQELSNSQTPRASFEALLGCSVSLDKPAGRGRVMKQPMPGAHGLGVTHRMPLGRSGLRRGIPG